MTTKCVELMARIIGRSNGLLSIKSDDKGKSVEFTLTMIHGVYKYTVPSKKIESNSASSYVVARQLLMNAESDRINGSKPAAIKLLNRLVRYLER